MDGSLTNEPAGTVRRKPKWGTLVLVVLFHLLVIAGLGRAFAPDFTAEVVDRAAAVLTVTITAPPDDPPEPPPQPEEGAAAPEGPKAKPREVAAQLTLPIPPTDAPRTSSTGTENQSGAGETEAGTGGGGAGSGTGSGASGTGQGNGRRALEKLEGDINSAKDYPKKTRELRIGHSVTILLTVGTDGRVSDCAITDPGPDPAADAITCRLAQERFRFRPVTDARGNPVVGKYAWRQRWFQ